MAAKRYSVEQIAAKLSEGETRRRQLGSRTLGYAS
jgi:hypothetical protein